MFGGGPGGNQPDRHRVLGLGAVGVHHDQVMAPVDLAQGNPAVFVLAGVILVIDGDGHGVFKHLGGQLKADAMLVGIAAGFGWVPFKIILHSLRLGGL